MAMGECNFCGGVDSKISAEQPEMLFQLPCASPTRPIGNLSLDGVYPVEPPPWLDSTLLEHSVRCYR